jgi:hypothetical protein
VGLLKFGFSDIFVNWIMQCVSTVSFSIIVNGGKTKWFRPIKGLRQGDPLSPYLFILCQDILSRMIEKEHRLGQVNGVKMNLNGPPFTHVMYADDLMLFARASTREVKVLDECLEKYCLWLGQLINREKSGLIFSKLVQRVRKRAIKCELNMKAISMLATYLGAPLFSSTSRSKDFKFLQERLESKLKGWRCKTLSWAGRSTLIKSVAHALPNYTFSAFDVPVSVCNKLDAASKRFWWNPNKSSGNYLAWKSWEQLCFPKCQGGLGFRKSKCFNNASLAKLTWLVTSNRKSIRMQALRSKYRVKPDWLSCAPVKNALHTWRAIEKLKTLVAKGACFLVGDGVIIDIWTDPWVLGSQIFSFSLEMV